MVTKVKSATLAASGEATEWIGPANINPANTLDLSVECDSAWVGIIELQKSRDGGETAHTVESYTADTQKYIQDNITGVVYRLYCTARSSGSAVCELYK